MNSGWSNPMVFMLSLSSSPNQKLAKIWRPVEKVTSQASTPGLAEGQRPSWVPYEGISPLFAASRRLVSTVLFDDVCTCRRPELARFVSGVFTEWAELQTGERVRKDNG